MALQFSQPVRDGQLVTIDVTIGPAPRLRIRTGAPPADTAAERSGTVLADITLPDPWLGPPINGSRSLVGTWQDLTADDTGAAGHFEIMSGDLAICHMQGTVTAVGGGGDMEVDDVDFTAGLPVTVTAATLTAGNA
jgi:hypothetical protein